MSQANPKPDSATHWAYRLLAVLLTGAIVCVVFWHSHPAGDPSGGDGLVNPPANTPSGDIEEVAPDAWRVVADSTFVLVTGKPAKSFEYRMRPMSMMDDDTRSLVRAYRTLMLDPNAASSIGLSDEQLAKLRKLQIPRMVTADEPRQRFERLWHEWQSAAASKQPAAREAMLNALRELGRQSADPTRRAWADAAEQVKKTLTLQQMAKLAVYQDEHGFGGFGGPWAGSPASQPH